MSQRIDIYTSLCLLVGFVVTIVVSQSGDDYWDLWWNYESGVSGPSSWGSFYPKWNRCGDGKRQSPIDISPKDLLYDPNLKHIWLSKHKVSGTLINTGHDLTIQLDRRTGENEIILRDGPLSYEYRVDRIVVHFGGTDRQGSEHRIDGKTFPAEVQLIAYNDELYNNMTVAQESNYGLAAISLLVAVNDTVPNSLGSLLNDVSRVQYRGTEKSLTKFSLHDLLPDTMNYMTYDGSLTKPGCYETVTWIVMNKPIYVNSDQMSMLRQTVSTEMGSSTKSPLQNNYRPVQSVNRRPIRTNINFPLQKTAACDIKREKSYEANDQVLPWI